MFVPKAHNYTNHALEKQESSKEIGMRGWAASGGEVWSVGPT